jgi:hypothetical protein
LHFRQVFREQAEMAKPIKACRECAHLTREPAAGKNRIDPESRVDDGKA